MPSAAPVLVVGTGSIHLRRFVAGLCAVGQRVVLASDAEQRLIDDRLVLEQFRVDLSLRNLGLAATLSRSIARWRPQVLHVHQAGGAAWHAARAAARSGVPLIITLWGSDVLRLHEWNWLHRLAVRRALRRAAAWTADARALLDAAQGICGPDAGALREWIPIGIDPPAPAAAAPREPRVLSCRLHKPLYRIDAIVRAFARLPDTRRGWILEVAGAGSETAALQQLAQGLGRRVEFTGMLAPAQLALAYRRCALFVSVPESDGTSVSLLEAMAAGCLPVLSDLPANREWVRDGLNGLLVGDLAGLDGALMRAMDWWQSGRWDREDRQRGERVVLERALLSDNIAQFIALYRRVRADAGSP